MVLKATFFKGMVWSGSLFLVNKTDPKCPTKHDIQSDGRDFHKVPVKLKKKREKV